MQIPDYSFSIVPLLKEAFRQSEGVKGVFIGAVVIYVVTELLLAMLFMMLLPSLSEVLQQLISILMLPLSVGIMMLGIQRARKTDIRVPDIFDYFGAFPKLLLAYILMVIFIGIGFLLFILPGIYLSIAYIFTLPLIVDKNLTVWQAMELSRKTVTREWFRFFGLSLLGLLMIILSIIPFGIGLIWSIPTLYIAYGLLYHQLFDDEEI